MFSFTSTLFLVFLSPRSDNEVDQVLRGFLATKETFDSGSGFGEECCYAHGIEVRCVVPHPSGVGIIMLEGRVWLSADLEHETNSKEVRLHSKASKCLGPDET